MRERSKILRRSDGTPRRYSPAKLMVRRDGSRRRFVKRRRHDRNGERPKPILRLISPADIVTLMNFLCGILAVMYTIDGGDGIRVAIILILAGAVFDGLDGIVARRFGSSHNFGKWLDSIGDSMTFCIAPAFLTYKMFDNGEPLLSSLQALLAVGASLSIAILGILRLARFSMVAHKWRDFVGLPTPALAFVVISTCGFMFWSSNVGWSVPYLTDGYLYVLPALLFLFSWTLVSDIRYVKPRGRSVLTVGACVAVFIISQLIGTRWAMVGMGGSLFAMTISLLYLLSPLRHGPRGIWGASRREREFLDGAEDEAVDQIVYREV